MVREHGIVCAPCHALTVLYRSLFSFFFKNDHCSFDKWIKVVMEEFFHIGDLEKEAGMKISMNQCRKSTGIDKCQQGFIVFVVKPLYEQMTRLMPGVEPAMAQLLTNVATLGEKLAA